ncbi:hypothetical protein Pla175_31700 [Pirellulimonas nuda]|uniref:Glycosyl hydrolase family 65 central catalytic domain protein n=1 Tax=Pirellulimonas nuda TaxID=2528009 RepID=A0A518DE65_9BACT|nr:hypothetical protein [Pirellulimonas nuda]QDU89775.1 hypothetical protein Pla175_31700 [Pirellulimonas nuda]
MRPRILVLLAVVSAFHGLAAAADAEPPSIDRRRLVERHDPRLDAYAPECPLSVGNGEFAFTFDITGLQTFPGERPGDLPLGTMAQWSWHAFPDADRYRYAQTLRDYPVDGRFVSYATDMESDAAKALRANPHRFNLARIGLRLLDEQGACLQDAAKLEQATQRQSLWSGEATSKFQFEGKTVRVQTLAHPSLEAVAFSVASPLVGAQRAAIEIRFAYPAGVWGPTVDDWSAPETHRTELQLRDGVVRVLREMDSTRYAVDIHTNGSCRLADAPHTIVVEGASGSGEPLECVVSFVADATQPPSAPDFAAVRREARGHWQKFWTNGGAMDLSASSDPRWRELERRIVLSQYLTAIHCAGSMPPQETGLACNSWFGKAHLEMHWWHAAHFALWGRFELLERSLGWYQQILPAARAIAARQSYKGVRWPKMTGPDGVSSPSEVGELLIWQQPHPIYFAELAYRRKPTRQTLEQYRQIVAETAEFMADYARYDGLGKRYVLGPVLIPAQECYDGRGQSGVLNPTFELAYWRWALRTANAWQERLGEPINQRWSDVAEGIAPPNVRDGVYTAIENAPFTLRHDHPSMLAALGVLPDVGLIDPRIMRRTLKDVDAQWQWPQTWGWDYPMMAMTAARTGQRGAAIDSLLRDTPKNHYLANGHCRQADRLPIYLPANGGLLAAAAMMAAGWDGSEPLGHAPGFPNDGSWVVRHEGLQRMP